MAIAVDRGYWNQLQNDAERRWELPPGVLNRTMEIESSYRPEVIRGEQLSSAGAIGGMQLMPHTAKILGVDPLDPVQATEGAARLWREALDRWDGDIKLAAADYNAGAPVVSAVLRGEREFKPETVRYMARFDDFLPASATAPPARPPAPANAPPARPIPLQPQQQPQQQPRSLDDMLMTELTRRPEPRQNNVFDFMGQIAPLVAASMGNPQMIGVTSMIAQQLANMRQQEADREDARQDRLLQLAVLRGKDTRTAGQREFADYQAMSPQQRQQWQEMQQAKIAPSYTPYTIPQTGETGVVEKSTGQRIQQTPGTSPEERAAQRRQQGEQEAEIKLQEEQGKQAIKALPEVRETLSTIDYELENTRQLLADLDSVSVAGPWDYGQLVANNPSLADRLKSAFSQGAAERLDAIKGAASDADLALVIQGAMPNLWQPGAGAEKGVRENLERRISGLERLKRFNQEELVRYESALPEGAQETQAQGQPGFAGMAPDASISPNQSERPQQFEDLPIRR